MVQTEVCPKDLRFTQDSIKNTFKPPYDYLLIGDVADQIRSNLLSPNDFSPMNVVEYENRLWSFDNRRLWVFRHAEVPRVKVNLVSPSYHKRSAEFFQTGGPRIKKSKYYKPSYLPKVRGPLRNSEIGQSSIISLPPPLIETEVCPEDLRFTQSSIKNTFKPPHNSLLIGDVADRIRLNILSPNAFSPMNVVDYQNTLWSLDNRRLWVFRHAGVSLVKVNLVPSNYHERSATFFGTVGPRIQKSKYYKLSYLPEVRGPLRKSDIEHSSIISPNPSIKTPDVRGPLTNSGQRSIISPPPLKTPTISERSVPNFSPASAVPPTICEQPRPTLSERSVPKFNPSYISEQPRATCTESFVPKFSPASADLELGVPLLHKNSGEGDTNKEAKTLGRELVDALVFGFKTSLGFLGFVCLTALAVSIYALVFGLKKIFGFLGLIVRQSVNALVFVFKKSFGLLAFIVRHGFIVCLVALAIFCLIKGITNFSGLVNQLGDIFGSLGKLWRGLMSQLGDVFGSLGRLWRGPIERTAKDLNLGHVNKPGDIFGSLGRLWRGSIE